MTYNFIRIRTKERKEVDRHNCVKAVIDGFTVEPVETIVAVSDSEAVKAVMKNYKQLLNSYEFDEDYMEWQKQKTSDKGTIFVELYKLAQEGETIDWRYNG